MYKKNILIVEDEFISALSIKSNLEATEKYDCKIVSTGNEAIEASYENSFDLIVFDIGLPDGLDGIEAARQILLRQKVSLIFMSGYSDKDVINRASSLQPAAFLIKPINEQVLEKEINKICL